MDLYYTKYLKYKKKYLDLKNNKGGASLLSNIQQYKPTLDEKNSFENYKHIVYDDCEDIYDYKIKNPETNKFEDTENFIYRLNNENIKDGDYLYAVRTTEPDEIWVAYAPVIADGAPGENIYWGDEDEDLETRIHHNCLVEPNGSVFIAGELIIRSQPVKTIYINCRSGHYRPRNEKDVDIHKNNFDVLILLLHEKFPEYEIKKWENCAVNLISRV